MRWKIYTIQWASWEKSFLFHVVGSNDDTAEMLNDLRCRKEMFYLFTWHTTWEWREFYFTSIWQKAAVDNTQKPTFDKTTKIPFKWKFLMKNYCKVCGVSRRNLPLRFKNFTFCVSFRKYFKMKSILKMV